MVFPATVANKYSIRCGRKAEAKGERSCSLPATALEWPPAVVGVIRRILDGHYCSHPQLPVVCFNSIQSQPILASAILSKMSNIPAFFFARDAAHSQSCPLFVDQCERVGNNAEQHITLLQDSHGHASIQDIGINSPSENTYCSSGVKFVNQTSANTIQNAFNSGMMGTAIINGSHNNINLCVDKPHIATLHCSCKTISDTRRMESLD